MFIFVLSTIKYHNYELTQYTAIIYRVPFIYKCDFTIVFNYRSGNVGKSSKQREM